MFNSLSRIFGYGVEEAEPDVEKGKQRAVPSPSPPPSERPKLPSPVSKGTPNGATNGMNRMPSSMTLDRSRGPSQVSWITPSPSPSHLSPSNGSPSNGGSTPKRMSRLIGLSDENAPKRASGLRKSFGSESLLASSAYLTDSSNGSGVLVKPLPSSIEEPSTSSRFPVMRRLSLDSVPLTPDSTKTLEGNSHPGYMAFLNRPLKRTISQGSTKTFGTATSTNAPSIPPIDLRPNFANSLGLPATPVRRSQFMAPSLPTVAGSPRTGQPSIIYEDDDTNSFITAPSDQSPNPSSTNLSHSEPEEVDIGLSHPQGRSGHSLYATTGTERSHMTMTSGFCDYELPARPSAPTPPHSSQSALSSRSSLSVLETISRRSHGSDATAVETAIARRWRLGLSVASYKSVRKRCSKAGGCRAEITYACVLFWLGFVAPWCWLLGGWYLAPSGQVQPEGQYLDCIPVWGWPRPRKPSGVVRPSKRDADPGKRAHRSRFWPFHAHAQETQPISPVVEREHGSESMLSLQVLAKGQDEVLWVDPWVRRCKIAAMVSGVALAIVVIVLLVVFVGVRR